MKQERVTKLIKSKWLDKMRWIKYTNSEFKSTHYFICENNEKGD